MEFVHKGGNEQSLLFLCMNLTGVWGVQPPKKENESMIQFMLNIKMVPLWFLKMHH